MLSRALPLAVLSGLALTLAAPQPATAATPSCYTPNVAFLTDRIEVSWGMSGDVAGNPASYRLTRLSDEGPSRTWTLSPTVHALTDRAVTVDESYRYIIQETTDQGQTTGADCWVGAGLADQDLAVAGSWYEADPTQPGSPTIQMLGLDGTQGHQFGDRRIARAEPAYSPSGRVLAWTQAGATLDVVAQSANETGPVTPLADDPALDESEPAWSPDGRKVAYTAAPAGGAPHLEVLDLATGQIEAYDGLAASHPAWTPDSRELVATNEASDTAPLLRLNVVTGAVTTIPGTGGGFDPDVSSTGYVAYVDDTTSAGTAYLRRTTLTGTAMNPIASASKSSAVLAWPRWAPDAKRIWWIGSDSSGRDALKYASPTGSDLIQRPALNSPYMPSIDSFDLRRIWRTDSSDFTGDGAGDLLTRDAAGMLWLQPAPINSFTPRMQPRVKIGSGWGGFTAVLAAGDLTNDGRPDLLARDKAGALRVFARNAAGGFTSATIGSGWGGYTIVAPGDLDGDGLADVVGRASNGDLYLFSGSGVAVTGAPLFASKRRIATGWQTYNLILGPGDLDSDGFADLVGRDSAGRLWLHPGNGWGSLIARRLLGSGWGGFRTIVAPGDMGYGTPSDLVAITPGGEVRAYFTSGYARFSGYHVVATGWSQYNAISG